MKRRRAGRRRPRGRARGAQVVGLCLGAYVLAAAGLLDERPATTHWAWADDFARRFPRVKLDPDVLYVDDGNLTSAGTAAGSTAACTSCGNASAPTRRTASRRLVIPPHRQGGQAQYVPQPVAAHPREARLAELLDWVRARISTSRTTSIARGARADEPAHLHAPLPSGHGDDRHGVAARRTAHPRAASAGNHRTIDRRNRAGGRLRVERVVAPAFRGRARHVAVGLSAGISRRGARRAAVGPTAEKPRLRPRFRRG
jgi:hypothetical protein